MKGKHLNDLILEKSGAGEILQVVDEYMLEFSVVNAVTALHRIAKADDGGDWRRDTRIKYLNRRITRMFASAKRDEVERKETGRRVPGMEWVYYIDTRSLCNAAWAFAQLHLRDDDMMQAVSEETCKKIYDCNAQQLAICAWSHAKMMRADPQLMQTIAEKSARRIQEFSGQHLMNIVWACAKLRFLHVELLLAVAHAVFPMLDDFTPQHLSITAWAFATLGFRHPRLMDALAEEALKTIRAFRPQNIANIAWAYATLDLRHLRLLHYLAKAARPRLREYSAQNLSNLAWSFVTLRIPHPELFGAIAEEVVRRVQEFEPQGLSMMAATFAIAEEAELEASHQQLFRALAAEALRQLPGFGPRDLESIVHSFAKAGMQAPDLFTAVAESALARMGEFNSLDLANIAWAFSKAGHVHEPLFQAVARQALPLIGEGSFPSQALCGLATAFVGRRGDAGAQLLAAVSREVERKLERQDTEHVVAMLELGLPCVDALAARLGRLIFHMLRSFPRTREGWWSDDYEQVIVGLKADHFGGPGTRLALAKLGVSEAPGHFSKQAAEEARSARGAALLDYDLVGAHGQPLQGTLLRGRGHGDRAGAYGDLSGTAGICVGCPKRPV